MPPDFDILISTDAPTRTAEVRLLDEHGGQLGYRSVDFKALPLSSRHGLFDLWGYLRHYVEAGQEEAALAEIGVCIAQDVLGSEIFGCLWASPQRRTLRIRLSSANDDWLAAALARVPWEIGRPAVDRPTLEDRMLSLRVGKDSEAAGPAAKLGPGESLRVLFVFAEARGSRALGARRERKKLQRLFKRDIYPKRRVVADTLAYGVTRKRLHQQIQENGGYHIVHWSGHGHINALELAGPGGTRDSLSGQDLLDLFARAGGIVPSLVVLSACQTGEAVRIKNWRDFLATARGEPVDASREPPRAEPSLRPEGAGYTGTAQALIAGGVPSVVAMRYKVGDDYARELAVEFYRALLAHPQPKSVSAALAMARQAMRDPARDDRARFAACDHVTALLYGAEQPGLVLPAGRSPGLDTRDPRLHRIAELNASEHESFVGRTWELAGLGAEFIGADDDAKPVALLTGLGGMGKTALAAEALALWAQRFTWVLLYQAKPHALGFEATLNDIHLTLAGELGRYHDHVQDNPADAIHRIGTSDFTGASRTERLIRNLARALRDEPILLVLDNFETTLKPQPGPTGPGGKPAWACQDPAWDLCLRHLAEELVGSPSRVLVTCRHPVEALIGGNVHVVRLGPLPPGEAALYLRDHPGLGRMLFASDPEQKALAVRLLTVSRFHPLLMTRLAALAAGGEALRPQLLQALQDAETIEGHLQLSALFDATRGDPAEAAYLENALVSSIKGLIKTLPTMARRLLWIISLANEPITQHMLMAAWATITTGIDAWGAQNAMIQAERTITSLDPAGLLHHLVAVGLATEEKEEPDDGNPLLMCHEVVRARVRAWMDETPQDLEGLTAREIRIVFGNLLSEAFSAMRRTDLQTALEAGRRAIVYFLDAEAYDRLNDFAGGVIVQTSDPKTLDALLPYLQNAALRASDGSGRVVCLLILADALDNAGRTTESLPFYGQAAEFAVAATERAGDDDRQAWFNLAVVLGNWAVALRKVGDLQISRERQGDNLAALRKAAAAAFHVLNCELEILRLDVLDGESRAALPAIDARVSQLERWWTQSSAGNVPPEAPAHGQLASFYLNGLDVSRIAHSALDDWASALNLTDRTLEVLAAIGAPSEHFSIEKLNRASFLTQLHRFGEAKGVLEECLDAFKNNPLSRARTLHSLADLLCNMDDVEQAIKLQRRAIAVFDTLPYLDPRSAAHHNLGNYLKQREQKTSADLAELGRHRLAALVYALLCQNAERIKYAAASYGILFHDDNAQIPTIGELMADAAFRPFRHTIREVGVDIHALQQNVDLLREQLRELGST